MFTKYMRLLKVSPPTQPGLPLLLLASKVILSLPPSSVPALLLSCLFLHWCFPFHGNFHPQRKTDYVILITRLFVSYRCNCLLQNMISTKFSDDFGCRRYRSLIFNASFLCCCTLGRAKGICNQSNLFLILCALFMHTNTINLSQTHTVTHTHNKLKVKEMHSEILFGFILLISTFVTGHRLLKLHVSSSQSPRSGPGAPPLPSLDHLGAHAQAPGSQAQPQGDSLIQICAFCFFIQSHKTKNLLQVECSLKKEPTHFIFSPFTPR